MAKASREAFGEALAKIGETNPDVVVLDADLSKSTKSDAFAKKFPDRFFDFGIAEANMVSTAAGLALAGKVPFACSFACFITSRFDQMRVSVAYARANVRIVGTHAGIAIGEDGYSQMGLEDIALMRSLPGFAVFQPADERETHQLVEYLATKHQGPAYLRLTRQKLDDVHGADYRFACGKASLLRSGSDVALLATGGLVSNALKAAEQLAAEGIEARVYNFCTIKPIDREAIAKAARETGRLVTLEDHTVLGGFGSAVCEVVTELCPVPVLRIGVQDVFGESGTPEDLYEKFNFHPKGIANSVRAFVGAKEAVS
ncbi:MAG: transketolase family protein [bacterium]